MVRTEGPGRPWSEGSRQTSLGPEQIFHRGNLGLSGLGTHQIPFGVSMTLRCSDPLLRPAVQDGGDLSRRSG